jgi:hypothetical protein
VAGTGSERSRVVPLPTAGAVVQDARGDARWMRVTWHEAEGVVVLSVWRDGSCVATVRVERADVPALVTALVDGLVDGPLDEPAPAT